MVATTAILSFVIFSLAVLGLAAEGETVIRNAWQVLRGYDDFEAKLRAVGADIQVES